ncbi:MAG: tRNA (adenosine(37)-N6)-dimethylallyltransferase MiaA [Cyclobacteriaceae bacterium]
MKEKFLISIIGPTAVGKTATGIQVAHALDAEILSADSRQFYKEMEIGTAKPTPEELTLVPHHFVNNLHIHEDYNVGVFEREALAKIEELFLKNRFAVMVGGSGLYVKALCEGIGEMPVIDMEIRDRLNQQKAEEGLAFLVDRLVKQDPEYAELADLHNPQRVIRALEVIESTGKTYTSFRKAKSNVKRPFNIIKVGLELPREILYERIDRRMDNMIADGLFGEAKALYEYRNRNALQTVGYREIFGFLDGKYGREEAIRLLKRNSRRYAKRQMTWFKKDEAIRWFSPDRFDDIMRYIRDQSNI